MNDQEKSKEQLIEELIELQKENNFLKALIDNEDLELKISQDSLNETRSRLALAMQGGKMAWWEMDVVTGNVTFDKRKAEMLGYPPENFIHYTDFTTLVHPEDYGRIMHAMKVHLEGKFEKYETEYRIRARSGEYMHFYDYGSVVKKDRNGNPLICSGFVYDITDRKKAEERMLFIAKAVESTSDAIGISDASGKHFYQNKALSDLFGYATAEEIAAAGGGQSVIHDPDVAKKLYETITGGEPWAGELEMVTKNGRIFPAFERADAIKDAGGNILGLIGIITEITERKHNKEALVKSEHMLQTVLDHFPGLVFWKDRQSKYLGCNQMFATGAGLGSPAEIVGKTDYDLPWALTEASNYLKDDAVVIKCGKTKLHIIEIQHQANGQFVWADTSKIPMRDSQGNVIGVIGISNDISKLKIAEQELIAANKELTLQNQEIELRTTELLLAKDKAEESDRLKTAFLNNISHEIRTPFNGILGFLTLLQETDLSNSEKNAYTDLINRSADRLMNTIDDIVKISQIQTGQIKQTLALTNINQLNARLNAQFRHKAERKGLLLTFSNTLPDTNCTIKTDSSKLDSILSSLLDNAVKFTISGSIAYGYQLKTAGSDEINLGNAPTELEFYVKDTGIGIPHNKLQSIFERFIQADVSDTRQFGGSGLGLSIAKSYVEILGGTIRVETEVGKGSVFYFTIPYSNEIA